MGVFDKLKNGLKKTRESISKKIDQVLTSLGKVDEELFEELEEILITSDVGVETSVGIIDRLRDKVKKEKITTTEGVREAIKSIISERLSHEQAGLDLSTKPSVIVVIGVNGVGKTTSIGKIAHMLRMQGKKVLVAAADIPCRGNRPAGNMGKTRRSRAYQAFGGFRSVGSGL